MQAAGAAHLLKLGLQPLDTVANQPAVGLDLCFARAAQEAETTALAFQMGPGPHQAAALVFQMRKFHLQRAFARRRTLAEDVEDEPGPVDHLAAKSGLQIALLHRAQLASMMATVTPCAAIASPWLATWPEPSSVGGPARAQRQDGAVHHHQPDRGGKADRFGQPCLGGAAGILPVRSVPRAESPRRVWAAPVPDGEPSVCTGRGQPPARRS